MKCDLCKRETKNIDTMILYSKGLNYCENCKKQAKQIRASMKYRMKNYNEYYLEILDMQLRAAEDYFLNKC